MKNFAVLALVMISSSALAREAAFDSKTSDVEKQTALIASLKAQSETQTAEVAKPMKDESGNLQNAHAGPKGSKTVNSVGNN